MKSEKLKSGDLVFIVSAFERKILKKAGCALVIDVTIDIPNIPEAVDKKETCTLLWNGYVEDRVDTEWVTKIDSLGHESVLAYGETKETP